MHFAAIFILMSLFLSCTLRDKQPENKPVIISPYDSAYNLIKEAEASVREGDLILRNGQEFSSQFIKNFNRTDKSYSHAGIVFIKDGYPYAYHITPGEKKSNQKLRMDSLRNFCNPRKNFGFAVYRYDMNAEEVTSFRKSVEHLQNQNVYFDSAFNLKTDDRMYCSEMIKKTLAKATNNRITIATTRPNTAEAKFFASYLHLPLAYTMSLDVVAIDNLFINPHCKEIRRFDFNPKR